MIRRFSILFSLAFIGLASIAHGQGMALGFGGLQQDPSAPLEVTSDELTVDQAQQTAIFSGNVLVMQGKMRMTAAQVRVEYGEDGQGIRAVHASGGVTLATEREAAEAQQASYVLATAALVMEGSVLLTQGQMAISGDRLVADLQAGTGRMEGRVRTVLQTGGD